jgi:hypothetical protein
MDGWMEADLINKEKEGTRSFFLPFAFAAYLYLTSSPTLHATETYQFSPSNRINQSKGEKEKKGTSVQGRGIPLGPRTSTPANSLQL